jgi:hypothetical protein
MLGCWWAGVCAALASAAGRAAEPTAALPVAEAVPPSSATSQPWPALPKDIPLGPGRLDIGAELRLRYEYTANHDVRRYGSAEGDHLLLSRTRLNLDYRLPENAHAFVEVQDSRFALSDLEQDDWAVSCPHFDQMDLKQAYLEWRYILGTPLGLKVGRQSISYGDNRVFGPGEWGNVGRYWWDAAKLTLNLDPVEIDLLHGQRVISDQRASNNDHYPYRMTALYARWKHLPAKVDTFYVNRYATDDDLKGEDPGRGGENRHTGGVVVDGVWCKHWDYGGTLAGQCGTYARDDIRTYGLSLRGGYTFGTPWSPRLGAQFTYGSGDSDPTDGTRATFDNIFGAVDTPYGRMRFLAWMNMEQYQLNASVKPTKATKFSLDYHLFRLAEAEDAWYWSSGSAARRDRSGAAGRELGQEIDLLFQWRISEHVDWFCGYCHFFAGDFIGQTAGDDGGADWLFNQVTLSF